MSTASKLPRTRLAVPLFTGCFLIILGIVLISITFVPIVLPNHTQVLKIPGSICLLCGVILILGSIYVAGVKGRVVTEQGPCPPPPEGHKHWWLHNRGAAASTPDLSCPPYRSRQSTDENRPPPSYDVAVTCPPPPPPVLQPLQDTDVVRMPASHRVVAADFEQRRTERRQSYSGPIPISSALGNGKRVTVWL